jgi:hypothetical protein
MAEVVTIVALLSSPNVFFIPFEQRDEVYMMTPPPSPLNDIGGVSLIFIDFL